MFQFTAYPLVRLWIHLTIPEVCSGRFPQSDISGSMAICASPKLFAAYHVLHRLLVPRHSPCALVRLTIAFALSWNKAVKWNEFWNIFLSLSKMLNFTFLDWLYFVSLFSFQGTGCCFVLFCISRSLSTAWLYYHSPNQMSTLFFKFFLKKFSAEKSVENL